MRHDFIKTGDPDAFRAILDRNGEVALSFCRRCQQAEGTLAPECPGLTAGAVTDDVVRDAYSDGHISIDLKDLAMFGTHTERRVARLEIAAILNARTSRSEGR